MKDYLFRKDLSVKQFASDLEISPSYLYQLIRKERRPSLELAQRIETITGGELTVDRLLGLFKEDGASDFTFHEECHRRMQMLEEYRSKIHEQIEQIESRLLALETIK